MGSNGRIGKVIVEIKKILRSVKCYTFELIDMTITSDTQVKMGRVIALTIPDGKKNVTQIESLMNGKDR